MLLANKMTHRGLTYLADRFTDGRGLLGLRLGHLNTLTISTPLMAKQALKIHDVVFSNRPASIAITYLTYNRADMAFAHYGPTWRHMHKLCVTKLFSHRHKNSWFSVRREVSSTVVVISNCSGRPVCIGEMIFSLAKNIIFSAAFGSHSHGNEDLIGIIQEFSKLFGAFNIGDFFPWLRWLDLNGLNKRLKKARLELDYFIDKIIEEHRENPKAKDDVNRDMVDEMLDFLKDTEVIGKSNFGQAEELKNLGLTRDNIKAIIMDIMFGGIETVASAIEWAMAELMSCPNERHKVQTEIAEVVGLNRRVEESDLDKLTYLNYVVKETLRLHPPIPLAPHETADDIILDGRFVSARTRVMINIWAIGRSKSAWKDPDAFRPSRFAIGERKAAHRDFRGSSFEFIPFGAGRRSCPGMQLGLYAMELALAELLHCFDWELPDGMSSSELSMEDSFGLTVPRAFRLVAVPTLRLTCPLEI
ncbi:hypothetical protein KFK09_019366 [Dendrobium nobile]|uniref:Cytochrome P450 n=1 Tax=Dendrobium nobile TaxID=94219 RepID=A0A8T3AQ23_DENNO|nr:hypothetical protein KFK09_019366 [Dendrobium nobile]